MRKAHGQGKLTEKKQLHLQHYLDGGVMGLTTLVYRNKSSGIAVIDATAGSGFADNGKPGSPIILNRHYNEHFPGRFRQLCCDRKQEHIESLQKIGLIECDFMQGDYQDVVFPWLESLPYQPTFGLLYVDVNGFKDAIDGYDLFHKLRQIVHFERIDLCINLSLNGYKRHKGVINSLYNGAPPEWVMVDLIDHMDKLASLKMVNFIRTELGALEEFVMLYGMQTDKVNMTRRSAGIIRYEEWRANAEFYLKGGHKVMPGQLRLSL